MLNLASSNLEALLEYLCEVHALPAKFARMRLKHSSEQDLYNRRDPRAFCYCMENQPSTIYATQYLDCLPDHFAMGILYHEIGHHMIKVWSTKDEPLVDAWCMDFAPELNYGYAASVKYTRTDSTKPVIAQNLEFINLYPIGRFFGRKER